MITKIIEMNGSKIAIFPGSSTHRVSEFYGLSTDVKPTDGVVNADVFYEMDTGAVFLFDADSNGWLPQQ